MAGRVGVLALQGAFREHLRALAAVGLEPVEVRRAQELDGLSGLFVSQVGHGRTEIAEAGARQAAELAYFPLWSYAHPKAIELATRLADLAPGDLNRVFFTTSGSAAALDWLKAYQKSDADVEAFVKANFKGDDLWFAKNLMLYGLEGSWPLNLQVERHMKKFPDSGGKGLPRTSARSASAAKDRGARRIADADSAYRFHR